MNFLNKSLHKFTIAIVNIKNTFRVPYKTEHYSRNIGHISIAENLDIAREKVKIGLAIEMIDELDDYHEMGYAYDYDPSKNVKIVSLDGKKEDIYNIETKKRITDSVNLGTDNFSNPKSFIGHFFNDMVPYYLWGNSESDPTTIGERITHSYTGNVSATKQEAAEYRKHQLEERMKTNYEFGL